jgi:hypothetical protein
MGAWPMRSSRKKIRVLYYDDQGRYREQFVNHHAGRFRIEVGGDVSDVLPSLLERDSHELPDLLLLDLYHDIDSRDEDQCRLVEQAEEALEELDEMLQRVKTAVDRAWQPVGLDVVEEVRGHFSPQKLAIMIYSRRGLFFLDEGQMKRVEEAEADWMLKDGGEHYEVQRIRRITEEGRAASRVDSRWAPEYEPGPAG